MNKERTVEQVEGNVLNLRDGLHKIENTILILKKEHSDLEKTYSNIQEFQKLSTERAGLGGVESYSTCSSPHSAIVLCNEANKQKQDRNSKRSEVDKKISDIMNNKQHDYSDKDLSLKFSNKLEQKKQELATHESILQRSLQELENQEKLLESLYDDSDNIDITVEPMKPDDLNHDQFEL